MTALVRDRKGFVSSTYMSFIGIRLGIKGRILFYWVVVQLYRGQYNTVLHTVVIIYDNILDPMPIPNPCDYSRGLPVFCFFLVSSI